MCRRLCTSLSGDGKTFFRLWAAKQITIIVGKLDNICVPKRFKQKLIIILFNIFYEFYIFNRYLSASRTVACDHKICIK